MRNIKLSIQYDGSAYHGWQRQKGHPTIQEVLESALRTMTGEEISLVGSGRTDAGVHALCQTANFRTTSSVPLEGFLKGLNSLLPDDVAVLEVVEVPPDFHSIRDAVCKVYDYRVLAVPVRRPLWSGRAWIVPGELDLSAMKEAAGALLGTHDFSAFQASGSSVATSVRTVYRCEISIPDGQPVPPSGGTHYTFAIAADGFLRYMVRNIVGFLVEVGAGRRRSEETMSVLRSRERSNAGPTAPAHGLCLREVYYNKTDVPFYISS